MSAQTSSHRWATLRKAASQAIRHGLLWSVAYAALGSTVDAALTQLQELIGSRQNYHSGRLTETAGQPGEVFIASAPARAHFSAPR
jgi:hypothetical protein